MTRSTEKNEKSQKRIQKLIDASITVKEKVKGQEPQKTSATEDCRPSEQSNENKNTFMKNIDIIEYSCEHCNYQCADSASLDVHVYTKHSSLVWLSREYLKSYFWNLNNPWVYSMKSGFFNALPVISLSNLICPLPPQPLSLLASLLTLPDSCRLEILVSPRHRVKEVYAPPPSLFLVQSFILPS